MEWIKRNLYFVIGSVIALVLMGLAGWYLYSKWDLNTVILGQLDEQYSKLKELNSQNPHPGSGDVDNIKIAKEERGQLLEFIKKSRKYYDRIAPIPATESGKVTSQEFSTALSRTIDHLLHDASKANVTLPTNTASSVPGVSASGAYSFSFSFQSQNVTFAPGSTEPLSVQLGEVKAISDILFEAKINNLDYIRRERVSDDDLKGAQDDYVSEKSVTNELAVLTPYEISFRGFSAELAQVLAGFGKSPYALVVKNINVEHTTSTSESASLSPAVLVQPPTQMYVPPPPVQTRSAQDEFSRRYGTGPARPAYTPPPQPQPQVVAPPVRTTTSRGGLPTALDEKQLKVTMTIVVVKLLTPAAAAPAATTAAATPTPTPTK